MCTDRYTHNFIQGRHTSTYIHAHTHTDNSIFGVLIINSFHWTMFYTSGGRQEVSQAMWPRLVDLDLTVRQASESNEMNVVSTTWT